MNFSLTSDHLPALRLMLDTAALVLIWLVQLVIYPAFLHFRNADFKRWHPAYTRQVTYVVFPVMLGQLALYALLVLAVPRWHTLLNLALVLLVWAITFLRAVPLHDALNFAEEHLSYSTQLVTLNWWRTGLWTLVWVISLMALLQTN